MPTPSGKSYLQITNRQHVRLVSPRFRYSFGLAAPQIATLAAGKEASFGLLVLLLFGLVCFGLALVCTFLSVDGRGLSLSSMGSLGGGSGNLLLFKYKYSTLSLAHWVLRRNVKLDLMLGS